MACFDMLLFTVLIRPKITMHFKGFQPSFILFHKSDTEHIGVGKSQFSVIVDFLALTDLGNSHIGTVG